jgi:hypothetical protein
MAIIFGTEAEFQSAGGATYISVAVLSSSQFVVAYRDDFDSGHGTAKVGTISGTNITFGAEVEFRASASSEISAAALNGWMPDGSPWRDSGCGPCPPVIRVPRGASDVAVTDDGMPANPRITEG